MPADESDLKARYWTSGSVDAHLRLAFAPSEHYAAATLLSQLVGTAVDGTEEDSDEASCRLMLDAIKVSEGDLVRLRLWVEAGRRDPRDLIAAAEYRRELQGLGEGSREDDLAAYLRWVSGVDAGTF